MTVDLLGPASHNAVTTRPGRTNTRGIADTWFQDCSSSAAQDGTVFPADYFNDFLAQMRTVVRSSGVVQDNGDDMIWRAMESLAVRYGVDSGTAGAIVATCSPPVPALRAGLVLAVPLAAAVPGATTLAVDGLTAKALVRNDGAFSALQNGDGPIGATALCMYDGTRFILLASLSATLSPATAPFFPEILSGSAFMVVSATGGVATIATAQQWQWRGLRLFSTSSFTTGALQFATVASKTYHLRWDAPGTGQATPLASFPNGRFTLRDLADAGYNPSSLPENNGGFDSTFDSMLVARIVTDGSNNATITALTNQNRLQTVATWLSSNWAIFTVLTANHLQATLTFSLNWSRAPKGVPVSGTVAWEQNDDATQERMSGWANNVDTLTYDRYGITLKMSTDFNDTDTLSAAHSSVQTSGFVFPFA